MALQIFSQMENNLCLPSSAKLRVAEGAEGHHSLILNALRECLYLLGCLFHNLVASKTHHALLCGH